MPESSSPTSTSAVPTSSSTLHPPSQPAKSVSDTEERPDTPAFTPSETPPRELSATDDLSLDNMATTASKADEKETKKEVEPPQSEGTATTKADVKGNNTTDSVAKKASCKKHPEGHKKSKKPQKSKKEKKKEAESSDSDSDDSSSDSDSDESTDSDDESSDSEDKAAAKKKKKAKAKAKKLKGKKKAK
jgi:hypothetical protein